MATLADNAYTTLSRLKSELEQSSFTSDEDDLLKQYINQASDLFESLTDRVFYWREGHVEYVAGRGGRRLVIGDALPVDTLNSIVEDDGHTTTTVDSDDYRIEPGKDEQGFIERIDGGWQDHQTYRWGIERQPTGRAMPHYKVDYDGGYVTQQQDDDDPGLTRDLPWDIEMAVVSYASMLFTSRGTDQMVKSKKIGSFSVTYVDGRRVTEQMAMAVEHYRDASRSIA